MFPAKIFIDADKTSPKNTQKLGSNMTMGLNIMVIIGVSNRFEGSIIRCTKLKAQNIPAWWSMML